MDEIISVRGLVKEFEGKRALNGLDLDIRKGEFFGFLGPNGAGKTTTIRCISTLTDFNEGTICVGGYDVDKDAIKAKELMGVIQQNLALDKDLTIRENMITHAMYHLIPKAERDARIRELSDYFGLNEYLDKSVNSLSGGWKKRAAIVCAMLHEPAVLFLDEPTTGLDINARRLMWDVMKKLNKRGTTIILTTHYIEEAEALCDRVAVIDHGKLVTVGIPSELCEEFGSTAVEYVENGETKYEYFKNRDDAKAYVAKMDDDGERDIIIRKTNLEDVFVGLTGQTIGV